MAAQLVKVIARTRIGVCCAWLLVCAAGFVLILNYQNAGMSVAHARNSWPAETRILLHRTRDSLIVFAHPKCPCTRATLGELNHLLAQCKRPVAVQVWFLKPAGFPDDWTRSDLWRMAAAIPSVSVHEDMDGIEARRFGAETSGAVLLYDTQGKLLFRGGITAGRGHMGENVGESAILSLLAGRKPGVAQTLVYGCSLVGGCVAGSSTEAK